MKKVQEFFLKDFENFHINLYFTILFTYSCKDLLGL